ncbi:hypothetical protein GNI_155030 [Gregarina niphandrodes]|uniref:Uncharacterized protein n=1 Tax=Gregarina niphandrodes TaxID=110365 RepID=A0A023B061_GRENI|nr:hypothetical protein GNI_155030 [Gregarina niphandrodes]EZG43966.1 hypothetical protein GNI_155030 [Gregarina niphandrodes]|eukprot:XP_011132868.1 hypothetical protein GNI_155030 [Gregarina niphandrodes]
MSRMSDGSKLRALEEQLKKMQAKLDASEAGRMREKEAREAAEAALRMATNIAETPGAIVRSPKSGQNEVEGFRMAFDRAFSDQSGLCPEAFWSRIRLFVANYTPTVYRSPVCSVVQSSGCGKSRLIKETAVRVHPLVYVSLQTNSGYPRGLEPIVQTFTSLNTVAGAFAAVGHLLRYSKAAWDVSGGQQINYWSDFMEMPNHDLWSSVAETVVGKTEEDLKAEAMEQAKELSLSFNGPVLIVFDEAQTLLMEGQDALLCRSPFRLLRQVARELFVPTHQEVVLLFTSTYSRVQNFAPLMHYDSARAASVGALQFEPIIDVGPWYGPSTLPSLAQSCTLEYVCQWGRPLWRSTLEGSATPRDVLQLAMTKLGGGSRQDRTLALLGILLKVPFTPGLRLPETMVKLFMAIVRHVAEDRETVIVDYLMEPILSLAAFNLIRGYGKDWPTVLRSRWLTGAFMKGSAGECVAQMRCLGSILVHTGSEAVPLLSVQSFLERLLGGPLPSERDGQVGFTAFSRIDCDVTPDIVASMFAARLAITAKQNEPGVDLYIPVLESSKEIHPENMSVIAIQVKNWLKPLTGGLKKEIGLSIRARCRDLGLRVTAAVVLETVSGGLEKVNDCLFGGLVQDFPWPDGQLEGQHELQVLLNGYADFSSFRKDPTLCPDPNLSEKMYCVAEQWYETTQQRATQSTEVLPATVPCGPHRKRGRLRPLDHHAHSKRRLQ